MADNLTTPVAGHTVNPSRVPGTTSMYNNTRAVSSSRCNSAGYYVVLVVMTVVIAIAILGNVCNMVVILRSTQLRHSLSNFFLISLCLCDLLAASFVMPLAAATFAVGEWPLSDEMCDVVGFATTLFMFVSMITLCVISVERFYSIRLPMHHAAHMTVPKTVAGVLLVWLWSALLAVPPLLGLGSYAFRRHRYHCSFTWNQQGDSHRAYIGLVSMLCFVLPGLVLLAMYLGIFFVARKAAVQIRPVPQDSLRGSIPTVAPIFTPRASADCPSYSQSKAGGASGRSAEAVVLTAIGTINRPSTDSKNEIQGRKGESPEDPASFQRKSDQCQSGFVKETPQSSSRSKSEREPPWNGCNPRSRQSGSLEDSGIDSQAEEGLGMGSASSEGVVLRVNALRPARGHCKAVKTLLILLLAYTVLWGPYFILHLHGVIYDRVDEPETTELVALWLSFSSFAVNPFLYGWMNKAIREELTSLYRRVCCLRSCCPRCFQEVEGDFPEGLPDEDFLQFLERTSQLPETNKQVAGNAHPINHRARHDLSEANIESSGPF